MLMQIWSKTMQTRVKVWQVEQWRTGVMYPPLQEFNLLQLKVQAVKKYFLF